MNDPNDPAARTLTVGTTRARSGFDKRSAWASYACRNVKKDTALVCIRKPDHRGKHRNGREEWT